MKFKFNCLESNIHKKQQFMKTGTVGTDLLHAGREKDRQTDRQKRRK